MKRLTILLSLIFPSVIFSAPLETYRTKLKLEGKVAESEAFAKEIRQKLPTHIAAFTCPLNSSQTPRPVFSSSFFRKKLNVAAEALLQEERIGKPELFDPSKFIYELEKDANEGRRKVFTEKIVKTGEFEKILSEMHIEFVEAAEAEKTKKADTERTADEIKTAECLEREILGADPETLKKDGEKKDIVSRLGHLVVAQSFEGKIQRLKFEKATLNLPMLVNVWTGFDSYFVLMFAFFLEHAQAEADSYYQSKTTEGETGLVLDEKGNKILRKNLSEADIARKDKIEKMLPMIESRVKGAIAARDLLVSLSREQLSILIDLAIALRGSDIPVPGEISDIKDVIIPEIATLQTKAETDPQVKVDEALVGSVGLSVREVTKDLVFYDEIAKALYLLSESFVEPATPLQKAGENK